jgi:uncharacterized protein
VFRGIKYNLYISCKSCNSIAAKFLKSEVIEYPTYTSTGQKKLDYKCLACGHISSTYVTLPMLTRSSSSSSGGSFGSSSFGSSSSSFGGGSSGGGGATSSW